MYGARTRIGRRPRENAAVPNASATRRARALTAAALTATLALAACCSDAGSAEPAGEHSVLGEAAAALREAEGTAKGEIHLTSGDGSYAIRWQGDFADGQGTASGRLPGEPAPDLDARWTGGHVYVRRTVTADQYGRSPLGQLTGLRPDTAIWVTIPADNIVSRVVAPLSPPDLVAALSSTGKQTVSDGPEVGGVATRKVVVTDNSGILFNWLGPKRAEVLLDGRDRARRITVTSGAEKVQLDVSYSEVAPDVQVPPAGELAAKTPPAPGPIGPYRTVRTGNDGGVAWTLGQAPGRNGTSCWRWSSTPPLEVVQPNYQTDTRCIAPASADDDPADQVEFVLWTDGTKAPTAAVVAAVPPGITQATLGFVGGRTEPATITDGLLTWVGSSAEPLGYVGFQSGDTTIACGVAAVSSPADLTNDTLVGDSFHAPWSCQIP